MALPVVVSRRVFAFVGLVAVVLLVVAAVVAGSAQAATGYTSLGSFGSGPSLGCPSILEGELCAPKRVAVDADTGNVFVVDSGSDRVQVFAPETAGGSFLTQISGLDDPYGVAIDQSASPISVYVSLAGSNRVVKLDSDGNPVPAFSESASFVSPLAGAAAGKVGSFRSPLAVDPTSGDLLLADTGKDVVTRYTPDGGFVSEFDGSGSPDGQFTGLEDLAIDATGDVFVIDAQGSAVDGSPSRLDRYSSAGVHELSLRLLAGTGEGLVAVDDANGAVLVGDARPGQYPLIRVLDKATGDQVTIARGAGAQITGLAIDSGPSGRLYAPADDPNCGGGCGLPIAVQAFAPNTLPTSALDPITIVDATTATLEGSVNPNGFATSAWFELSTDGGNNWYWVGEANPTPGDGNTPVEVSLQTTGLSQDTTYHARIVAANPGGGETYSNAEAFTTTAVDAPIVTLDPPANVDADSAELSGSVNPQSSATTYRFQYSSDGGSNWASAPGPDGNPDVDDDLGDTGTDPVAVSAELAGLAPATTYLVRLVATNPGGEVVQDGQTLTTDGQAPTATTHLVGNLQHTSARLTGFVDANNQPTTYRFEWGTTPDNLDQTLPATGEADAGSGDQPAVAAQPLSGLQPNTTYHYRLVSTNPTDTTVGETKTFTTRATPPARGAGVGANGDRGVELVNNPDKNGMPIWGARMSDNGERVVYTTEGGTGESAFGRQPAFVSDRTPSGWKAVAADPPRTLVDEPMLALANASTDQSTLAFVSITMGDSNYNSTLYRHSPASGITRRGTSVPPGIPAYPSGEASIGLPATVMSPDLGRVVTTPGAALVPEDPSFGLYDITDPVPVLIGLLPGEVPAPCGVVGSDWVTNVVSVWEQNHISADGSRVFFLTRSGGDCSGPRQLYVREGGGAGEGSTTLISGPVVSGEPAEARFLQASRDGSLAFFMTAARLDARDSNDDPDIYRHTLGEGNFCVTCAVPNADVVPDSEGSLLATAIAQDGSTVFFGSRRALAPGAIEGSDNVYRWRAEAPEEIVFVAPSNELRASSDSLHTFTSADGGVLIFGSRRPELNELTGSDNGGLLQLYRYSVRENSLACVSCPESGPAMGGFSTLLAMGEGTLVRTPMLGAGGEVFVFSTAQSLVASDVNGVVDVYEWRAGRVGLISDGRSPVSTSTFQSNHAFGVTADGGSVLFQAMGGLTGEVVDDSSQVYVARIGGGFAAEAPAVGCEGDACQGQPGQGRAGAAPGSGVLDGAGDAVVGRAGGFSLAGLSAAARVRAVQGRRFGVRVRVGRAGRVTVVGRARLAGRPVVVVRGSRRAGRAGTVAVALRLSRPALRRLAAGRLVRVTLAVSLSGAGEVKRLTFGLRRAR